MRAEMQLRIGDMEGAARYALRSNPRLRGQKEVRGLTDLRAARVMAMVMVRTDGAWLEKGKLKLGSEKERGANFVWAIQQLRIRAAASPKSAA